MQKLLFQAIRFGQKKAGRMLLVAFGVFRRYGCGCLVSSSALLKHPCMKWTTIFVILRISLSGSEKASDYWTAGPAAATSAGLVPFALGTETGGSIIYPANTCGVTAHRTSFGLVGRSNIMSLSESLVSHPALSPTAAAAACTAAAFTAVVVVTVQI